MSIINSDSNYWRSLHRRDDSGELDVFEAARYFSGYTDIISSDYSTTNYSRKTEALDSRGDIARIQPTGDAENFRSTDRGLYATPKEKLAEGNNHGHRQQPCSPGRRLASFLNSLFSQSASKKKKKSAKSSMATQSLNDDGDEGGGGGWRSRRRSSISHFRSSSSVTKSSTATTMTDSKSLYSSSSSGFRTPPPSKSYKDRKSLSDHKDVINITRPACLLVQNDKHRGRGGNGNRTALTNKYGETGEMETEFMRTRKFGYDDEDYDSDSSSDLFELQNYDLGYCSSGLPVYETTLLDSIKRGPSMSNVAA
ncbi:hypothetical protein SAY86_003090 [Trapa natans]|uniref:Protein BIG GRAIN 1-like E n=1 Tax=Trapa natans TaxID=22666 RepID=A0AAN7LHC6_TRANT|nr:hypothetical protein SAY86_003090 [Trapa natans]